MSSDVQLECGFGSAALVQGIETPIPKVVPLKVPLNILPIWPLYYLGGS